MDFFNPAMNYTPAEYAALAIKPLGMFGSLSDISTASPFQQSVPSPYTPTAQVPNPATPSPTSSGQGLSSWLNNLMTQLGGGTTTPSVGNQPTGVASNPNFMTGFQNWYNSMEQNQSPGGGTFSVQSGYPTGGSGTMPSTPSTMPYNYTYGV